MKHLFARWALCTTLLTLPLCAATISWTQWTTQTVGTSGAAGGSMSSLGVTVSYVGENESLTTNASFNPASTFSGGTVSNAPLSSNQSVALYGGSAQVNTITFSAPVVNPVMAIWSLGSTLTGPASFNFTALEPFTIVSGGPSAEYGGTSITSVGNTVFGAEGSGVIQFIGTFSQISWTNPVQEKYYTFTVGAPSVATTAVPEPTGFALLGAGLGLLAIGSFRKSRLNATGTV